MGTTVRDARGTIEGRARLTASDGAGQGVRVLASFGVARLLRWATAGCLVVTGIASGCGAPAAAVVMDVPSVARDGAEVLDAEDGSDAGEAGPPERVACQWRESAVVCGSTACPAQTVCAGPGRCVCRAGYGAFGCDGRLCASEASCGPLGGWYCARLRTARAGACPTWEVGVPASEPTLRCSIAPEPFVDAVIARLNTLWGSAVRACPCERDALGCYRNALVFPETPGVIHYDPMLVTELRAVMGAEIAAALVFGHELGHGVQVTDGQLSRHTIHVELGADCYAGYFLGYLRCLGEAPMEQFAAAYMSFCQSGDRPGIPWWSPAAHGTCAQRVAALMAGIEGYGVGANPAVVCRLQVDKE